MHTLFFASRCLVLAAMGWLALAPFGSSAEAASFVWSSWACQSADCTQVGSVTRYSNVIAVGDLAATGNRNRDLLVTVVSLRGGATVSQAPNYTTGASYFEGQVMLPNLASNASQVVFRLDFVTVGGTAADPIDVPVYLRSIDTDGNLSSITGGVTERIEYMPPSVTVIAGSQLGPATAYDGGVAFRAKVCTTADASIGCSAVGDYPTYSLATAPPFVAAEANYSAGVSSMTFAFGGETPAAGAGGAAYLPRLFGMQGGILVAPNMTAAVTIAPTVAGPGSTVTGSLVCTNRGTSAATSATCTASGLDSTGAAVAVTVGACTASSGSAASLPVNATLTCAISYTQPGTANSGTNAAPTHVTVTATTSAANEPAGSTADNSASDNVETIDAIDDAAVSTPAGTATSLSVF
ncbi:MAG: hypothetical protein KA164_22155, partial [Rhodoferax sp.]|nr:hypothetical protein [Rhodoferax sp.]